MALAEGPSVSVGVLESGMSPVSTVGPASSLTSSFSAESLAPTVNFPGFTALSGDASLHVAGDSLMSGNPLTDPGWVNYSPLMGDGMLPPGLALEQAMEVAAAAWETSGPLSGYSVIAEAESIATEAWRTTETSIVAESSLAIGEPVSKDSTDESIATEVAKLAEEVGLPNLADRVRQYYHANEEVLGETSEQNVDGALKAQDGNVEETTTEELVPVQQPDEQDTAVKNSLNEKEDSDIETDDEEEESIERKDDQREKVEEKDEQQKPPSLQVFVPVVDDAVTRARVTILEALAHKQELEVNPQRRVLNVVALAEEFKSAAPVSPIREQLSLGGEEPGILATSHRISQISAKSAEAVVGAVKGSISPAVVLAEYGIRADDVTVKMAVGSSRRNPFS